MIDRSRIIEQLDSLIDLSQELNDLWDKNTKIMESHVCCNTHQSSGAQKPP